MPKVRISAVRFSSLLTNRNMDPAEIAERVKTGVDPESLARADMEVDFDDVLALATLFKRPWSYLLIDEAEHYPSAGSDNRTFANRKVALSPDLLAELQAAELMLEAAEELFPGSSFTVPVTRGTSIPVGRLADATRSLLGVSIEAQLATTDEFAALRLWVGAIHGQGVYVAQRRLRDATTRAFSKVLGEQAVIIVDTGDTPYARIFSALHEFCHVTLRSTGICDLDGHSTIEQYCNAVAAEVLLPDELLDDAGVPNAFAGEDDAVDEALRDLSQQLHVSQAALLIRLRDYGTITQDSYDAMEVRRSARRGRDKGRQGGSYYPSAINQVGRLFAHRVVEAVTDGAIDRQDASVLLGIGEHLVPTYVTELAKGD